MAASCLCPTSYNRLLPLSRYKFPRPEQQPVGSLLSFFAGEIFQHFLPQTSSLFSPAFLANAIQETENKRNTFLLTWSAFFFQCWKCRRLLLQQRQMLKFPKSCNFCQQSLILFSKLARDPVAGFQIASFAPQIKSLKNQILEEQLSVAEILQCVLLRSVSLSYLPWLFSLFITLRCGFILTGLLMFGENVFDVWGEISRFVKFCSFSKIGEKCMFLEREIHMTIFKKYSVFKIWEIWKGRNEQIC